MSDRSELQGQWTSLYRERLPALAKERNPVQNSWPVHLDHCFARIILDNSVGIDRPWTEVVKQPAVKNMSVGQLREAIELAEQIATGQINLADLNDESLRLRGKKRKASAVDDGSEDKTTVKVKTQNDGTISSYFQSPPQLPDNAKALPEDAEGRSDEDGEANAKKRASETDMSVQLKRISESNITPFRKKMLTMLCQVPRGRYSTYQAMSDYVSKTSHKTCARAVGSAMRNNPFAPQVPCHRILAHDGTLGGFNGHWGENGKFASKKHELLYGEGVRFDSRGKVKGPPFREFWG